MISKVDVSEIFKKTTPDRIARIYVKDYEDLILNKFTACSKRVGGVIETTLTILDLQGVGLSILGGTLRNFIKLAADIAQNYYPEMLGQMWLINTSFMFSAVWAIVKGFIDEKTRNKFNLEKSDYSAKLLEIIEADNLPAFLGGNCTCPHVEGGCLFSDAGPWESSD